MVGRECAEYQVFSSTFGFSFCISKHSGLWLFPSQCLVSDQLGAKGPTGSLSATPRLSRLVPTPLNMVLGTYSCLGLLHVQGTAWHSLAQPSASRASTPMSLPTLQDSGCGGPTSGVVGREGSDRELSRVLNRMRLSPGSGETTAEVSAGLHVEAPGASLGLQTPNTA